MGGWGSDGIRTWTGTRSPGSNSTTSGGDSGCAAGVNNMTIEETRSKNNYTLTTTTVRHRLCHLRALFAGKGVGIMKGSTEVVKGRIEEAAGVLTGNEDSQGPDASGRRACQASRRKGRPASQGVRPEDRGQCEEYRSQGSRKSQKKVLADRCRRVRNVSTGSNSRPIDRNMVCEGRGGSSWNTKAVRTLRQL